MEVITAIVPCYNEEESLPLFYEEICRVADSMKNMEGEEVKFQFLFVDDGSRDNTLSVLRKLSQADERVKYISFSRNFGKESAILAGFTYAKGDYVVLLDADLQHPPSMIPEMYHWVHDHDEYDCAAARRTSREGEAKLRSFFSTMFYKIINKISDTTIMEGATDFRLMNRSMVDTILSLPEFNRFSKGIFGWVGFNTKWLPYTNVTRAAGETKWSFWKLLLYSFEGIIAFSTAPLALASLLGLLCCLISIIITLVIIVKTIIWGDPVAGFPTLACIITFLGGLQLFCIGIVGQYLAKTYMETKRRPSFVIREKSDFSPQD